MSGSHSPGADMPILTELETGVARQCPYKYAAPSGAVTHVPRCEVSARRKIGVEEDGDRT